jgi:hypothetical protein
MQDKVVLLPLDAMPQPSNGPTHKSNMVMHFYCNPSYFIIIIIGKSINQSRTGFKPVLTATICFTHLSPGL